MKITITYSGAKTSEYALRNATNMVSEKLYDTLINKAYGIANEAKRILDRKIKHEDKSTGRLESSIVVKTENDIIVRNEEKNYRFVYARGASGGKGGQYAPTKPSIDIRVGPDLRIAPYAEYVEFGHYKRGGSKEYLLSSGGVGGSNWWEGYHYMEEAWEDVAPTIYYDVVGNLNLELKKYEGTFGSIKHKKTDEEILTK